MPCEGLEAGGLSDGDHTSSTLGLREGPKEINSWEFAAESIQIPRTPVDILQTHDSTFTCMLPPDLRS
eukprot:8967517-Pyramimonas_sp.AAC.1